MLASHACKDRARAYLWRMTQQANNSIGGTPRATQRPAGVSAPDYWTNDSAPPAPAAVEFQPQEVRGQPDPVRYGDWEIKGIAIDF